jgi:putative sterol carrier protein
MAEPTNLRAILSRFAEACSSDPRLRAMNRDWTRTVAIQPTDGPDPVFLRYEGGTVGVVDHLSAEPDLVVEAETTVLADIFSGRLAPTEPYLAGDLRVYGSQDDMMRLDIITLLIWGE